MTKEQEMLKRLPIVKEIISDAYDCDEKGSKIQYDNYMAIYNDVNDMPTDKESCLFNVITSYASELFHKREIHEIQEKAIHILTELIDK